MTAELRLVLNPYMATTIPREAILGLAPRLVALLGLWLIAAAWLRTYRELPDGSFTFALFRVAESSMIFCAAAIVLTFFVRSLGADLSRSFVLLLAPLTFLCLVGSLVLSIYIFKKIQRRWPDSKRVAILGSEEESEEVLAAILRAADCGIAFCGLILPERCAAKVLVGGGVSEASGSQSNLPVLGTTGELPELINRECLDRIIVASESLTEPEFEYCGQVSKRMGVTVSRPIRSTASGVMVRYRMQYGLHLIDVEAVPFSHWQEVIKRGIDVVLSLTLITVLLPLIGLLACLVRLTSKGPFFYKSQRVGKGGRYFTFWKFRSMYVDGPDRRALAAQNERGGHLFKIRNDPRVTPLGRVMRRLSLDELPQLFHVLAGDMSLVGPRPLPIEDLDKDGMSRSFKEWAEQRSQVRPGITGLWQTRGRSELPFTQMMELDLEYVRHRSIMLDLKILMETPRAVVSGHGAY